MRNNGLFSTLFLDDLKQEVELDDLAKGRMATLGHAWKNRKADDSAALWDSFLKQALGYLNFVPANQPVAKGMYPLHEDYGFTQCLSVLYLLEPGSDLDDATVGRFWPAKLVAELKKRKLNWGILTDGATWRLYSLKSSRPFEDYVELPLAEALAASDEGEYGLFERFFHIDSFVPKDEEEDSDHQEEEIKAGVYTCRLDDDRDSSEGVLEEWVKKPLLAQVDEVLQYLCNGFILDTKKTGEEYTEDERREIFESAVKLLYRCLFLFYAEARRLLPSEEAKSEAYRAELSIHALCEEARKFKWGQRSDHQDFDLWQHLKGLVAAVNDGDPEYGIMGYNGGLFDDSEEKFLGEHRLRNDFLSRALYLLAYVEPYNNDADEEYEIPYEDLEVRHLGELYENILEFTVSLCDADRLRRRTKKGVQILLASENKRQEHDTLIKKGDVYFGESALERKQTGSYYTPESLVRFLNEKAIIVPLRERFDADYRARFAQFLDSIEKGVQQGDVKGAARSAVAQVQRFVEDVVLEFRACDPAMGSGHFLVDAANQMAGLVVELLAEIPDVPGMNVGADSSPNSWRRQITRRCLYGVDLNPLAVNLAKLSLWLNCFAVNHKLTFLDHHLRCGNSLIGVRTLDQLKRIPKRKKDGKKKQEESWFDLDDLSAALGDAAERVSQITDIDEDDTDRQKSEFEEAHQTAEERLAPLADLFTAYLMDDGMDRSTYERLFDHFTGKNSLDRLSDEELEHAWSSVEQLRERHHFFHYAIEFADAMGGKNAGFNAAIGNPPWDVLEPDSEEFYLVYDPGFRKLTKTNANKRVKEIHANNPAVAEKWGVFEETFKQAAAYCKELPAYSSLTKGKIDLYKAFLERFHQLLVDHGRIGIVCPSGFYTDLSAMPLRDLFLTGGRIHCLFGFENRWPQVFKSVHSLFKFIVLCSEKGASPGSFKCSFMQHDPQRLAAIEAKALMLSSQQVRQFAPNTLSLMEVNTQRAADIVTTIYDQHPHLGDVLPDAWNVQLSQEFNMSSDSHLFNTTGDGCTLYEGKLIAAFDHEFSDPNYWIAEHLVQDDEWRGRWRKLKKRKKRPDTFDYQNYRLGFRNITASANERGFISTLIPKGCVCPHTTLIVRRLVPDKETGEPVEWISADQSTWLVGLFNSFVLDYVIRMKITTHIDMHFVYTLPLPRMTRDSEEASLFFEPIVARCMRLLCTSGGFDEVWDKVFSNDWESPDFWYPSTGNMDYGPAHEQEIREQLAESAKSLSKEWTPSSGVHDRLPDRRDTGDRAQLRAEIDAYVAHLYGLSRDDFAYILDTFPVLERKEMKAFGEFMSKRKCLEEHDRLASIVGGAP